MPDRAGRVAGVCWRLADNAEWNEDGVAEYEQHRCENITPACEQGVTDNNRDQSSHQQDGIDRRKAERRRVGRGGCSRAVTRALCHVLNFVLSLEVVNHSFIFIPIRRCIRQFGFAQYRELMPIPAAPDGEENYQQNGGACHDHG
jgi:hypothetical protein